MSLLNGLLQVLTLRCEAASELLSRELDEPLTRLDRAALRCHLLVCRSCRRFAKQIRLIREAVRRNGLLAESDSNECLSPEARQRITRVIREGSVEQADGESPTE